MGPPWRRPTVPSVADWAEANNAEIAFIPTDSSWLKRIEAQFTALRYFALDGTDHRSHREQGSMIRRYIIWRNRHTETPGYANSSPVPTWPETELRRTVMMKPSPKRISASVSEGSPLPLLFVSSLLSGAVAGAGVTRRSQVSPYCSSLER